MKQEDNKQNEILENIIMKYIKWIATFKSKEQIIKILNIDIWDIKFIKIYETINKLWSEELQEANIKNICVYQFLNILKNKTNEYLKQNEREKNKN